MKALFPENTKRIRTRRGLVDGFPTPEQILAASEEHLRSAGLSRAKMLAIRDLAAKALDGTVPTVKQAHKMSDEELIERLDSVRGIGRWTVEMLLMFRLGRPDVLPVGDYGVRKGFAKMRKLAELPKPKELMAYGERWRPYRSVASWYMWRAAEMKDLPLAGATAAKRTAAKTTVVKRTAVKAKPAAKPKAKRVATRKRADKMKVVAILLLSFAALTAWGQDMAGNYVLHGVMEVGSELLLKPDGKFEFMLAYGAADYWAKGTWSRDGNAVVLHSAGKEEAPFRLVRSEAGKPGRIRVVVLGQNGKGVENIDVHLLTGGKALDGRTDSEGAATFPTIPRQTPLPSRCRFIKSQPSPSRSIPPRRISTSRSTATPSPRCCSRMSGWRLTELRW